MIRRQAGWVEMVEMVEEVGAKRRSRYSGIEEVGAKRRSRYSGIEEVGAKRRSRYSGIEEVTYVIGCYDF
ncbi:MAG: hypothetical protein V2A67_06275 [Bacteroidota bacterium]